MVNNSSIMFGIIIFFVALGVLLPLLHEDFNQSFSDPDETQLTKNINEDDLSVITTPATIIFSVFKMFFWTFGAIPTIIDLLIFLPLRILLAVLLLKTFLPGGSG